MKPQHPEKPPIFSKIIEGARPRPDTEQELRKQAGMRPDQDLMLCVFECLYGTKIVYAAWAGGYFENGDPMLTTVGLAAFEALLQLPLDNDETVRIQELRIGPTPLEEKVKTTLDALPEHGRVLFVGDLKGELDGLMGPIFQPVGHVHVDQLEAVQARHAMPTTT